MATLFIDVLRQYMRAGKFKIHDFVVMRNHVHLLITVSNSMSIEKAMQLIKGNFSYRARTELGLNCEIWQRGSPMSVSTTTGASGLISVTFTTIQ